MGGLSAVKAGGDPAAATVIVIAGEVADPVALVAATVNGKAPALEGVQIRVLDHYVNEALTSIIAEAEIMMTRVTPPATLRVADRFTVNAAGRIVEQENHFDPRDVTHQGWQSQ